MTADETKMKQALSTKKKECAAVEYTSTWLQLENFPQEASFGKISSFFALFSTCYLGRSKVTHWLLKPLYAWLDFASMATRALHTALFQTMRN